MIGSTIEKNKYPILYELQSKKHQIDRQSFVSQELIFQTQIDAQKYYDTLIKNINLGETVYYKIDFGIIGGNSLITQEGGNIETVRMVP